MVKARARTAAKKVKDKWKSKQWYAILAPAGFNKVPIAETPSDDPEKLVGRVVTTTMQDLTGDFKLMHVKLDFQVERVNGTQADTKFIGHNLTSDSVRRLVRRNHSKVFLVVDAATKDGAAIRVKPIGVTEHRAQSSQLTLIRRIITETISASAAQQSLASFVKEMVDGRLTGKILKACKPIYPLRKLEMNKSEVRQSPTITLEDLEPAKTEGAEPAASTGETPGGGDAGGPAAPEEAADKRSPEEGGEEPQDEPPAVQVAAGSPE